MWFCGSKLEALLVEELVEERYWLEADGYGYENFRSEVLKTTTTALIETVTRMA
jgi:hypothetical protein